MVFVTDKVVQTDPPVPPHLINAEAQTKIASTDSRLSRSVGFMVRKCLHVIS